MSRSTGPVLATGALAWASSTVLADNEEAFWPRTARIAVATGVAAGALSLLERASEQLAVGLAWLALVTTVFVRIEGEATPAERLVKIANKSK